MLRMSEVYRGCGSVIATATIYQPPRRKNNTGEFQQMLTFYELAGSILSVLTWSENGQSVPIWVRKSCGPCPRENFARFLQERTAALHQLAVSGDNTLYGKDDLNGTDHCASSGITKRMIKRDLHTTGLEERHFAGLAN
jgi:hypothetical protein